MREGLLSDLWHNRGSLTKFHVYYPLHPHLHSTNSTTEPCALHLGTYHHEDYNPGRSTPARIRIFLWNALYWEQIPRVQRNGSQYSALQNHCRALEKEISFESLSIHQRNITIINVYESNTVSKYMTPSKHHTPDLLNIQAILQTCWILISRVERGHGY